MADLLSQTSDATVDNALLAWFPHFGSTPTNLKERAPLKESELRGISDVLRRTGREAWSCIPRVYTVLRIINQLQAIDRFVNLGVSDIWFPFTANTLPDTLRSSAKSAFLNAQRLVLTKALSLEQEDGKHRHFLDPAELPFTKIAGLGRGSFGLVDHVVSTISHREYARKRIPRGRTFHNDRKVLKDFENELSNLKKLSHYHIIELVGSYTDSRSVCLLMAPIADCNLKEYLDAELTTERRSPLCNFFGCLTSANVLVKGGDHVYLTDFGLALDYSEAGRSTTTAEVVKSPRYCSPELAAYRPRNTASDIWSLGCVFLEMWTVIRERTVTELTAHLESTGSRSNLYYSNIEGINSWCSLNATRLNTRAVDAPLAWIENILVEAPDRRWTASLLLDQIQEASNGPSFHPDYCGTCCLEGSGLVGTVHSPTGTDETFYEGAEDKNNGLDASDLASLTTSLALATKNHPAAEHRQQHDEEPHRQTSRACVEEKGTTIPSRRDPTENPRRKGKDWDCLSIGSSSSDYECSSSVDECCGTVFGITQQLEITFHDLFEYRTQIEEIGSYPLAQNQLNHMVARFVADNDGPDSLLIVYYSGLFSWTEEDGTRLHGQRSGLNLDSRNSVRWDVVEQNLLHGPEGDILDIFDASYAVDPSSKIDSNLTKALQNSTSDIKRIGSPGKTAKEHTTTRRYQLLTSSGSAYPLNKPEPRFITAALIESLTQLVSERSKFPTTYQGYTFRKVPQQKLPLGEKVDWRHAHRTEMPITSDELEKRLRERRLKIKKTVSDEFMSLTAENQKSQVIRLAEEKESEEENQYAEWTLASV
ncbi:NEK protein kinase [Coniosporium apollinis CBS 100218]|uniref:non-specific serine/threonine protein kinase n=1 Tax=Coniosporium apollinis (strain CBS 100218) TaxID=1168221 RepID=R7YSJ9_CONA1|nr:NEK protein kinase [Coniosporium apollinis CBS 100218]EON64804.1 NEK protein kinase [Coniosporium apollinis CBS 100218]